MNLGIALMAKWRVADAIAFRISAAILEINANFAEVHSHLGSALLAAGRLDAAIASCCRAIELKPGYLPGAQ